MEVGRLGVYVIDLLFDYRAKLGLSGSLMERMEGVKGRLINFFSHGTPLVKRSPGSSGETAQ
jgi:hypothetical protein